jgi:hypothetical protein
MIQNILRERENPYLFTLNHYFVKWGVQDNPQRSGRFIGEIAKIFQNFKMSARSFLIEKISHLIKWNKEEVEPYFIRWNFPAPTILRLKITHCQEIISAKEKKILAFCAQKRSFWLLVSKKNYFYFNQSHRENYYKIYNYYMLSLSRDTFKETRIDLQGNYFPEEFLTSFKSKVVDSIFKEIDNIKKFMLKVYASKK